MTELQETLFDPLIIQSEIPRLSHYFRTTWMLSAKEDFKVSASCTIRYFCAEDAEKLAIEVHKRYLHARHQREIHFYVKRAKDLGNHTVLEFFLPSKLRDLHSKADKIASTLEKLAVLSSTMALNKNGLQKKLGISLYLRPDFDFIVNPDFKINSNTCKIPARKGIIIDERFKNRFSDCGFTNLFSYLQSDLKIAERVNNSIGWLFASRIEPDLEASVVKSSIALETLLIFSESESLARSLSERAAFILSSNPAKRQQISKIIKNFYNVRSGIVHGNKDKLNKISPMLLESVDRFLIMLYVLIAKNNQIWKTSDSLRDWCETQRWGEPSKEIKCPFSRSYLNRAIKLGLQG
jgi:hypothetical protein